MKLNIGAGGKRIEGYTGVDVVERSGADIIAPADKIPLPDGCAEEVMAIHLLEHLLPWDVPATLSEWFRVLAPGGRLVLEMPDIIKACKNMVEGAKKAGKHPSQLTYWAIYGDDRYKDPHMLHKFGYHFDSLAPMVEAAGFVKVKERPTQYHPCGREFRDFRLEALKPHA